jgi:hypothetical protein
VDGQDTGAKKTLSSALLFWGKSFLFTVFFLLAIRMDGSSLQEHLHVTTKR